MGPPRVKVHRGLTNFGTLTRSTGDPSCLEPWAGTRQTRGQGSAPWDTVSVNFPRVWNLVKSADLHPAISFIRKGRNPGNCNAPPPGSGYQILDRNRSVLWAGCIEVSIIPGLRLHSLGEIRSSNRLLHPQSTSRTGGSEDSLQRTAQPPVDGESV